MWDLIVSVPDHCLSFYLATLKVYTKFEDFGSHRSLEICDRNFYWREREMDK